MKPIDDYHLYDHTKPTSKWISIEEFMELYPPKNGSHYKDGEEIDLVNDKVKE